MADEAGDATGGATQTGAGAEGDALLTGGASGTRGASADGDALLTGGAAADQGQANKGAGTANDDAGTGEQGKGAQGAPETYEITEPEGSTLTPEVVDAFSDVARELNLTNEAAQKVVDKIAPAIAAQQSARFEEIATGWADATRTDKEFGGDQIDANLAIAKKALDAFGTPELVQFLNQSKLGNHPELIRAFYRAGKAISEDRLVPSGGAPGAKKPAHEVMYDKT